MQSIDSYWGKASCITANDKKVYILKQMKDEKKIDTEVALLSLLKKHGVLTAVPISIIAGDTHVLHDGNPYCLFPRLPGTIISEHYSTGAEERACGFGRAVAQFHQALAYWEHIENFPCMDLVGNIRDWTLPKIKSKEIDLNTDIACTAGEEFLN